MSAELQFKIYEDFLHYFLPEGLLVFFEPVMAEQKTHINPTTKAQVPALHLYFDERINQAIDPERHDHPKNFKSLPGTTPPDRLTGRLTHSRVTASRKRLR